MSTSKHIPEIDGLRAIAVLAVVLFHLQVPHMAGGFAGVDIFFVISGYLITSGLRQSSDMPVGTVLRDFYIRRARRLLPPLYAILLASSILALAVMSSDRLRSFGGSVMASALSAANVYFFWGSGYFDSSSDLKPLLHNWSLGVEEQFYLVWPITYLVAQRLKWHGGHVALGIGLVGLIASEAMLRSNASAAFFLMPLRVHEFMIGAVLAHGGAWSRTNSPLSLHARNLLTLIGLGLMAWAIFSFNAHTPFPGVMALVPCVGAALVLAAAPQSQVGAMLRLPPMRWLGKVSYSVYLVHWPLIVFYRIISGREHLKPSVRWWLLAATLLLGWMSWRWIENRWRPNQPGRNQGFVAGMLVATAALLALGWALQQEQWMDQRPWRSSMITPREIDLGKKKRFVLRQQVCTERGWELCDAPAPGKLNGLVIGDSHAVDAYNAFVHARPNDHIAMSEQGGCPPHAEIDQIVQPNHPDLAKCRALNKTRFDSARLKSFDYVVINVLMGWYTEQHLSEYLEFLQRQGIRKVIVFGQTWRASDDLPELINRHGFRTEKLMPLLQSPPSDHQVQETAKRLGYLYIDKTAALTSAGQFEVFDPNRVPFTYDEHHLSYEHSIRLLAQRSADVQHYLETK
jgi:peptidoglycan/LPS O-acetylase OafA/YrhL